MLTTISEQFLDLSLTNTHTLTQTLTLTHTHAHTHTHTHTYTHTHTQVVSHENKSKFTTISEQFQDLKTKFAVSEEMCKASKAQVWCVAACCSVFV